ncbi:HNH endonuclease [Devosia ginsengisoli]|uniref:HNH endonuclease n=1 Tax=Devosia ginsengisoli TaxID=400770 RepID=A0A5B8LTG2_9HYPH|nr:HNH endonuclease [Devosia ginsengisoli]QDZ10560.1 HNH endonuclease [Devosia ginsengisoli]
MARSRRYEFSKATMRQANERSGGRCEAEGEVYGLDAGQRCNVPFKGGAKEFDHYPMPATEEGSDTLDNCVTCCPDCHGYKTRTFDIPAQAKVKRVSDKDQGIALPKVSMPSQRLGKGNNQHSATRRLTKGVGLAYFEDSTP